jgi:hypothetical protein
MEHLRGAILGVLLLLAIYRLTRPRRPPVDLTARRFSPPWRSVEPAGREGGGGGARRVRRRLSFRR